MNRESDIPGKALTVLHLDSERGWSGGETQVEALLLHLRRRGHRNAVACPPGSALSRKCRAHGIQVFETRMRNHLDVPSLVSLVGVMRTVAPDIVHTHTSRAHVLGVCAFRLSGVPGVSVTTRRMDYPLKQAALVRVFYNRMTDGVVAISSGVRRSLIASGVRPGLIELIHSGVRLDRFVPGKGRSGAREQYGVPESARVAGIVAALIRRKGHAVLLEAMVEIRRRVPAASLLVVGDGPLRGKLGEMSRRLGLERHVHFTGRTENIPPVLAAMDLMVLPSLAEGLGVSLLEAMAMRLPVIGSSVGGIPDAVQDGVNGCLVPPRDSKAVADRVVRVLSDPELARKMGEAGRAMVERDFTTTRMAERNEAFYLKLLREKFPEAFGE